MKRRKLIRYGIPLLLAAALLLTSCGASAGGAPGQDAASEEQAELEHGKEETAETLSGKGNESGNAEGKTVSGNAETETPAMGEDQILEEKEAFRSGHDLVEQTDAYAVYEVPFERDGFSIYGQLYLPKEGENSLDEAAGLFPLVIIGHGLQSSYSDCAADAQYFAEAGIAACIFDFCGGSFNSESDGSFYDMSVLTEQDDMEAVLDSLLQCSFFDRNRIFLMGESQGGLVAALLAAKREADLCGLILYYPAFGIPDNTRVWFAGAEEIPEDPAEYGAPMGRRYYLDTVAMDAYAETVTFQKPVLLIHGDADDIVPLNYSERAQEEYENAELKVLPGAGHGFTGEALSEACGMAVEFVKENNGR